MAGARPGTGMAGEWSWSCPWVLCMFRWPEDPSQLNKPENLELFCSSWFDLKQSLMRDKSLALVPLSDMLRAIASAQRSSFLNEASQPEKLQLRASSATWRDCSAVSASFFLSLSFVICSCTCCSASLQLNSLQRFADVKKCAFIFLEPCTFFLVAFSSWCHTLSLPRIWTVTIDTLRWQAKSWSDLDSL